MFKFSLRKQKAAAAIRKWALRLSPDDGYVNYYQAASVGKEWLGLLQLGTFSLLDSTQETGLP